MMLSSQETWLIQGAPGAGKSALLSYLQSSWKARVNGPVAVRIAPNTLRNENNVTRIIANRIIPEFGVEILNSVRTIEAGTGVDMFIQVGGKGDRQRATIPWFGAGRSGESV